MRSLAILALALALLSTEHAFAAQSLGALRVGIVAYDDVRGRALVLQDDFEKIGYTTRFASGTADEVLDWISGGLVDIAVLSPGALAATSAYMTHEERIQAHKDGTSPRWDARYLATRELGAAESPFASVRRTRPGGFVYQALALANRAEWSELKKFYRGTDAEIVKQAAHDNVLQFVFGDPLSLSGTIVPKAQLKRLGIEIGDHWEFSFGHSDTIQLLLTEPKIRLMGLPRARIGFVFDASIPKLPEKLGSTLPDQWKRGQIDRMRKELLVISLPPPAEAQDLRERVLEVRRTLRSIGESATEDERTAHGDEDIDDENTVNDLPGEVLVTRPDIDKDTRDNIRKALVALEDPTGTRHYYRDQESDEDLSPGAITEVELIGRRVRYWAESTDINLGTASMPREVSIAEIVHSMRHFERLPNNPPARLALVLSGGGAKCAYQAGAIESIESALEAMNGYSMRPRTEGRQRVPPDFELVAGTSGGALNALPTAIGLLAQNSRDANPLATMWRSEHLTDLLRPTYPASLLAGLALATALVLLASVAGIVVDTLASGLVLSSRLVPRGSLAPLSDIAGRLAARDSLRLRRQVRFLLTAIASIGVVAFGLTLSLAPDWLRLHTPGSRPIYYLLWLPLHIGWLGAAVFIFATCTWCFVAMRRGERRRLSCVNDFVTHAAVFSAAIFAFLGFFAVGQGTLSSGENMQHAVFMGIRSLLDKMVPIDYSRLGDEKQQTTALSHAISDPELRRRRDFVMTVSVLGLQHTNDRYAYLPAYRNGSERAPSYEERAITLNHRAELSFLSSDETLVDLLEASGTIFPIFPAHPFIDSSGKSEDIFVIDGGFAHNIPIEAAVDWGATHIIAIEASPVADLSQKTSLIGNLGVAFDHLFNQAQMIDVRSRSGVEIYTLQPQRPILETFEFIPKLIDEAVSEGKRDAKQGQFVQYSRAPQMVTYTK